MEVFCVLFPSRFDVKGYVAGFGNPDWARTHQVATSTAPTVLSVLSAGATCVGKTVMDEMAYRFAFFFLFLFVNFFTQSKEWSSFIVFL